MKKILPLLRAGGALLLLATVMYATAFVARGQHSITAEQPAPVIAAQ